MIDMDVLGTPAPQGSKRHVGHGVMVESSKAVQPWREAIVSETLRSGHAGTRMTGPVLLHVTFYLPRPKGHHGARGLLPSAPALPHRRPDADKLLRSTLDALTQAGLIEDDAQITTIRATKRYADHRPPGARITIEEDSP